MKDNQKIQLSGLAQCYLVSIWYLLLSQRWGGSSRGGYEEKKAKKKIINLDYRKKNYTVNIIALSLLLLKCSFYCVLFQTWKLLCVGGCRVLQPCVTAGRVTTHRGLGAWRRRTTVFSGHRKVSSFCSVFKGVAFHQIVHYLYWVLQRIVFNTGCSRTGL